MRVAILNPSYEESDSPFGEFDPVCDPSRYAPEIEWHHFMIHKRTAVRQLRDIVKQGFDVYFNLCDGAFDEDRAGIEVVQALERFGCAYTGAVPHFYEPSRKIMKMICRYWDIDTPEFAFASDENGAREAARELRFPMIVKHENSYASIGMTRKSKVTSEEDLVREVLLMTEAHGGALIEEFIEGREFTVLVAENPRDAEQPIAYRSLECRFPEGETFKHYDLKWLDFKQLAWQPVEDSELDERLRELAKKMFVGCRGTGYGRCDIRMSADGKLHMLEINPNCGIFYPDDNPDYTDLILWKEQGGHHDFILNQLAIAVQRRRQKQKPWELHETRGQGYGMRATEKIPAGGLIERYEERPQNLVSRQWAQANWPEKQKDWLAQYAWPLSEDVHAMWAEDPADWRPINHACDPNSWLVGLDLVARRDILPGEPIVMDYATFCNEDMKPFKCECGAANCRREIKGTDHLEPFMEVYGEHISDYVRARRRAERLARP